MIGKIIKKRAKKAIKKKIGKKLQSFLGKAVIAAALFMYASVVGREVLQDERK